jgi:hypothetical protein
MISPWRHATSAALCVLACALLPAGALAAGGSQLSASLAPEALGKATTVGIGFQLRDTTSPLTELELRLPAGVTAGFNTLGLETCAVSTLEAQGPSSCPGNSVVGLGNAVVAVPLGSERLLEPVSIKMFMAPSVKEHTQFVFYARGTNPVIDQLVFEANLIGDSGLFGARLDASIPTVPGLPGSPVASVVSMQAQIGPKSLRYHVRRHGRTVAFTPEGFDVPASCPRGGFPFGAIFTFADGSHESAATQVPCPDNNK